ncbi:VOC family protein [Dethiothermospora halolimnae]|uniref:VOC family protein n=1 Tax=Dethiothermospora halolimnae TaxID=3114390 RepID=UPI003CCB778F
MNLTNCCIITNDVKRLSEFYEKVLQIQAEFYGEDYAVFRVGDNMLSVFDLKAHESIAPGSAQAESNKSIILEFNVENVDEEYERLKEMNIDWVKEPTIQPWGSRSFYLRDIDGNIISFYTHIK